MALNQTNNENTEISESQELNKRKKKMEAILKKRKEIVCHRDISFPCADIVDATELSHVLENDNSSHVELHKRLLIKSRSVGTFVENIQQLKQTSATEMAFDVEENSSQDNEILQAISRIRKKSDNIFKKIINTQVNFNEFLNHNIMTKNIHHKEHIRKHELLIEETCKFDKGIESILRCDKNTLEKHIKNLKIKNVNDFKNAYEDLAQGILSKVYETGVKTSKNHEHLLAIKKYNKRSTDEVFIEMMSTVKLDPFTKQPIANPVYNKGCKHVYDQTSIDQMFQNKPFISCPYIGCSKRFTKEDLEVNMINSNTSQ